ncbi:MAG: DUF695 domain-containing protein [Planctomycetota bacterium]
MDANQDSWDFYMTLLDGLPATIRVDLAYLTDPLPEGCTKLYVAFLPMQAEEGHGMGGEADRERLEPIEQAAYDRVRQAGGVPVGRIRSGNRWQLAAYGPVGMPWDLWMAELAPEGSQVADEDDPHAGYLMSVLLPNPERRLWIFSRRAVDRLAHHGDQLHIPRQVHHRVQFPSAAPSPFLDSARELGFDAVQTPDGLRLTRFDLLEIDEIHPVVVELVMLAQEHGGEYAGWECDLEAA